MSNPESGRWMMFLMGYIFLSIHLLCWIVTAVKPNKHDPTRGFSVFMASFWACFLIPMTIYAGYHLGPKFMDYNFEPILAITVPAWLLPLAVIYSAVAGAYFYKHVQLPVEELPYDAEYIKDNAGGAIIIGATWGLWVPIKLVYLALKPICIFLFKRIQEAIELSIATYEVIELHRRQKQIEVPPVIKKVPNEYLSS